MAGGLASAAAAAAAAAANGSGSGASGSQMAAAAAAAAASAASAAAAAAAAAASDDYRLYVIFNVRKLKVGSNRPLCNPITGLLDHARCPSPPTSAPPCRLPPPRPLSSSLSRIGFGLVWAGIYNPPPPSSPAHSALADPTCPLLLPPAPPQVLDGVAVTAAEQAAAKNRCEQPPAVWLHLHTAKRQPGPRELPKGLLDTNPHLVPTPQSLCRLLPAAPCRTPLPPHCFLNGLVQRQPPHPFPAPPHPIFPASHLPPPLTASAACLVAPASAACPVAPASRYAGRLTSDFLEERLGHRLFDRIRDLDCSGLKIRDVGSVFLAEELEGLQVKRRVVG